MVPANKNLYSWSGLLRYSLCICIQSGTSLLKLLFAGTTQELSRKFRSGQKLVRPDQFRSTLQAQVKGESDVSAEKQRNLS